MKILALTAFLALAAPAAAKSDYPPDPEVLLCPATAGDLDYAIDRTMTAAKFQSDPNGGLYAWRRRVDGPFHLMSAEPAQWFRVEFKRFRTSDGTRLVAEMRWQTTRYEFGVKQDELYTGTQEMLDSFRELFPCVDAPIG